MSIKSTLKPIAQRAGRLWTAIYPQKDKVWLINWTTVILLVWIWNLLYLNDPARQQIETGFFNTSLMALLVLVFTLILAWLTTLALHYLGNLRRSAAYYTLTFVLNIIRSVPQIVGVLFGYVGITLLIESGSLQNKFMIIILMAVVTTVFIFIEMVDLMRERIRYYRSLDFYNAMRVCGISESRIINFDILWKNSRVHIFNKLIALFGVAIFLQCSVDFIISVGLTTDVNAVNLPVTLGSLLAKIDSKQDILALGYSFTHPGYLPQLFTKHLQGITVAFVLVFSLLGIYKISNGFAERHRL